MAGGTTPREVIAKFKTMQMVDVHLPTTDGRELTLSRYTQPEAEHRMLLDQLRLTLLAGVNYLGRRVASPRNGTRGWLSVRGVGGARHRGRPDFCV